MNKKYICHTMYYTDTIIQRVLHIYSDRQKEHFNIQGSSYCYENMPESFNVMCFYYPGMKCEQFQYNVYVYSVPCFTCVLLYT